MFDLSWSELLLVGAIALVVIGPRELPRVLRTVGQTFAKLRRMAGDFQSQFNAAMREAELDDIRNTVNDVQSATSRVLNDSAGGARFDPLRTVRDELRDAIQKKAEPPSTPAPTSPPLASGVASSSAPSFPSTTPASPATDIQKIHVPDTSGVITEITRSRKRQRVVIAAPSEAVKRLGRPPQRTSRLYKKVRFSALPVRPRPTRDGEGNA